MAWYEKSFRRNLVDMHIEDWSDEFLSRFDPQFYFQQLKKAHIQTPMIYIQSHVGHCYWNTASGHTHAAFRNRDAIGELIDLCHGDGMSVVVYYSLIYNTWAHDAHPEWRMVSLDAWQAHGEDSRRAMTRSRYGLCCPNSPGYREFVTDQIREFCAHYSFEGTFFDMIFWPFVCYCDDCRRRWADEVGGEIPAVVDWSDPAWIAFQKKREQWLAEFAQFATDTLKTYCPSSTVEQNNATEPQGWIRAHAEAAVDACDFASGDLYGGFLQQSVVCKLYYGMTRNQPFEYMTSRCDPNLRDHTTLKSRDSLRLHNLLSLAHHGAFLLIDAIDPRGTLNPALYEIAGEVFGESMAYEPYLTGDMRYDVGLFFSHASRFDPDKPTASEYPHMQALVGAARTLQKNHIPYGVVNAHYPETLRRASVVVVPDAVALTGEERSALMDYVRDGGNLYLSGRTAPDMAADMLGLHTTGQTAEKLTYIAPGDPSLLPGVSREFPLTVFGSQVLMKGADPRGVLATVTLPYTDPADTVRFSSIHSNPPGIDTQYPAVIEGSCGKGRVLWVSASIERASQTPHRAAFLSLLSRLMPETPCCTADAPHTAEVILFEDRELRCFYVSLVNIQEDLPLLPLGPIRVRVRLDGKKLLAVERLPKAEALAFAVEDDFVSFGIGGMEMLEMFRIRYEK